MKSFPLRFLILLGILILTALVPPSASACSPVPYLFELMAGGTPFGSILLKDSLALHAEGMPVRGAASIRVPGENHPAHRLPLFLHPFAISLYLMVVLKTVLLRRVFSLSQTFIRLLFFVALANLLSTLPVFAFGMLYAVPIFVAPGTLVAFLLMRRPAAMLARGWGGGRKSVTSTLQFLLGASFIVNIYLLALAQNQLLGGGSLLVYWIDKIFFCTYTVATGLFVTSAVEGWFLRRLLPNSGSDMDFIRGIVRCNAYALTVFFALAALIVLPLRLASPDFLI